LKVTDIWNETLKLSRKFQGEFGRVSTTVAVCHHTCLTELLQQVFSTPPLSAATFVEPWRRGATLHSIQAYVDSLRKSGM